MLTQSPKDRDSHLQLEQIDGLIAAAGVEGTREILTAFQRSTADLLDSLQDQLAQEDLRLAAVTAHAVKGSAANVGAIRLADAAAGLENACRSERPEDAERCLRDARAYFEVFHMRFDDYLSDA